MPPNDQTQRPGPPGGTLRFPGTGAAVRVRCVARVGVRCSLLHGWHEVVEFPDTGQRISPTEAANPRKGSRACDSRQTAGDGVEALAAKSRHDPAVM